MDRAQLLTARTLLVGGSSSAPTRMMDRAQTDESGVAALSPPVPGGAPLFAFTVVDGHEVAAQIDARTAVLRLAGHGQVEVVVRGIDDGATFPPPGTALTVVPVSLVTTHYWGDGQFGAGVVAQQRDEGVFAAEGVTVGDNAVCLVHVSREIPRGRNGTSFVGASGVTLATCDVREGTVSRVTVDVGKHMPGAREIDLTRDGAPLIGALVVLVPSAGQAANGSTARGQQRGAVSDAAGRASLPALPPGHWTALVSEIERKWTYAATDPADGYRVLSGQETHVVLPIPLVSATLTVVAGESGEPLASASVMIKDSRRTRWLQTDEQGQIELTLPPGTYLFGRKPAKDAPAGSEPEAVSVEWGTGGPASSTVRLGAS